jgi:hypothetical protein
MKNPFKKTEKVEPKHLYRVQTTYCIIEPNGDAFDYYFEQRDADRMCEKLNELLRKKNVK